MVDDELDRPEKSRVKLWLIRALIWPIPIFVLTGLVCAMRPRGGAGDMGGQAIMLVVLALLAVLSTMGFCLLMAFVNWKVEAYRKRKAATGVARVE